MTENKTQSAIQLSDEVQEALYLARKLSDKSRQQVMQDRHLLMGVLKSNRLFTRPDALLKHAGTPPKLLLRLYNEELPHFQDGDPVPATAIDTARQIVTDEIVNESRVSRVEVEHLLLALTRSPDPLVQRIIQRSSLEEENIRAALPRVESESLMRLLQYCLRETVEVIVVVVMLVIFIKQGFGEFRLIPSESMLPTLQVGDRIVVEKVSRWYREPQRGDILVFYPPEPESVLKNDPISIFLRLTGLSGIVYDRESPLDRAFIKRVVGLPGDRLEVRPNDGVYVNGQKLGEGYTNEVANSCTFISFCGEVIVPDGMFFVMGDNRNKSADSRSWGFLPEDRVIGRAVFRFFPLDNRLGILPGPTYPTEGNQSVSR